MKKFILLTQILLLSLLMACESDTPTLPSESKALAGNISTRSNTTETLGEGSQILLNARGGLTIENELFTYNNGAWSNENGHKWGSAEETTHITALYPHDATSPYNGDALKDILISQATLPPGETNVSLIFKHLFASFTLNVDETLVDMISTIQLTTPQKIASIAPTTGEITLTMNTNTTNLTGNGSGSYTFIIPPMEASIELGITLTNGKSQTYTLQRHCFESGLVYECKLRDWNTVPGIRSREDFITFYNIVNGMTTGDLSKYGEEKDGKMIYRLLADINLEDKNLYPMFNETSHPFNHIFNGEGHTISNFTINAKGGYAGLFGQIGSDGIVKNLYINDCTMSISASAGSGVGAIAGVCKGIISNCGVTLSKITNHVTSSYTGGMVGTLRNGSIINSFIKDSQVTTTEASVGGIVGKIETGYILNCFSASNTITRSNNYSGGFCGRADNGNIINSYVYKLIFKDNINTGQFIGEGTYSSVSYCYSNTSKPTLIGKNTNESSEVSKCKTYSSNFMINESHIVDVLNQWIKANQSSYKYPFTEWKPDDSGNLPAIFR